MQEAAQATAFWESWFKAQQLVNSPEQVDLARQRVRQELEIIVQRVHEAASRRSHGEEVRLPALSAKSMLLWFRPAGFLGWVLHLGFYSSLLLLFLYAVGVSNNPALTLAQKLLPSLIIIVPLVLLNMGARARERRAHRSLSPSASQQRPG